MKLTDAQRRALDVLASAGQSGSIRIGRRTRRDEHVFEVEPKAVRALVTRGLARYSSRVSAGHLEQRASITLEGAEMRNGVWYCGRQCRKAGAK